MVVAVVKSLLRELEKERKFRSTSEQIYPYERAMLYPFNKVY